VSEGGIEVTDDLLDEWAAPWEAGEVPGKPVCFVAAPGRPRISDEETKLVAFRLPISIVDAVDRRAKRIGESRSQLIRDAVLKELLQV
jgi:hypothetical protein